MFNLPAISVAAGLALVYLIVSHLRTLRKPFPPGPPGNLILGNLLQIPTKKACLTFQKWSREYGSSSDGLLGLRMGPWARMIVLNKHKQYRDLLEGRSTVYAGRGSVPIMEKLRVWTEPGEPYVGNFASWQYNDELKRERRATHEYITRSAQVEKLLPIQDAESTQLMWDLLSFERDKKAGDTAPGSHHLLFFRTFGAVVLAAVYGIRGKDTTHDSHLGQFESIVKDFIQLLALTAAPPYEVFPFVDYIPEFINPWRGWILRGKEFRVRWFRFWKEFHDIALNSAESKTSREGDGMLLQLEGKGYSDTEKLSFGATIMNGGADTTAITCLTMLGAFVNNPDLQQQARAEIDAIFGEGVMPTADKLNQLPFVKACFYEAVRWRPLTPLMTRRVRQDHEYEGFFIPKDTMVLFNIWALSHDTDVFDRPQDFMPIRYLPQCRGDLDVKPLPVYGFGTGLRNCPGQKMAENSVMLVVAKLLWAFEISSPDGKLDTSMETGYDDAFMLAPNPARLSFRLRSQIRGDVVQREWKKADEWLARFE
ncbi:hypothetical protein PoMZ_09313 [Pyricularia oryzae]|uniref:Cytochrome P450 3A24 n=1 Tax=Pyricularia oryzae TaxID=318829 RepID=A0A4V1C4P7_PYROR|nr:hypothetical protein PoMZ_09313 [Pyricularia oryzae]